MQINYTEEDKLRLVAWKRRGFQRSEDEEHRADRRQKRESVSKVGWVHKGLPFPKR